MAVTAAAEPASRLLPARRIDLGSAGRAGIPFGIAAIFVSAVGLVEALDKRVLVAPWLGASDILLLLVALGAGFTGGKSPGWIEGYERPRLGARNVFAGAIAGTWTGGLLALFAVFLSAIELREIFVAFTPRLQDLLTFGEATAAGAVLLLVSGAALGVVGGSLHLVPERWRRALFAAVAAVLALGLLQVLVSQMLRGVKAGAVGEFLYRGTSGGLETVGAVAVAAVAFALHAALRGRGRQLAVRLAEGPPPARRIAILLGLLVLVTVLGALPQVLGNFLSSVMDMAGTFLLMALGLNIVVGLAGLLDLGYVAFFAVGAYATAVLTSPESPAVSPELLFWTAIPFIMLVAAVAGLVVGTPVLRMRGDYLAIVTLGFGEIARLIAQSDWQKARLGGAQGIAKIPAISIGPVKFTEAQAFFYLIFGFVLVFAYITYSLGSSRMGRAWNAMREDEAVAEAMGVNTVHAKLAAFVLGAIMAGLGGALFAHRVTTVFPHSFKIEVSITVLIIVIVGGMGSVLGVVLGALVLVGLPEILREFEEFKFLIYGVLLIAMMLKRPEGLIPSRRRARELREEEQVQDAWLRAEARRQEPAGPAPAEG